MPKSHELAHFFLFCFLLFGPSHWGLIVFPFEPSHERFGHFLSSVNSFFKYSHPVGLDV